VLTSPQQPRKSRLERVGLRAWLAIGVIAIAILGYLAFAALSSLILPLVVAVVIGMLFHPVVASLANRGLPRAAAAGLVLVGLIAVAVGAVYVAVRGIFDQKGEISAQLSSGWSKIEEWLAGEGVDVEGLGDALDSFVARGLTGATDVIQTGLSGLAAFVAGLFVGVFLLFYVLKDWDVVRGWAIRRLRRSKELDGEIFDDATRAVRAYFVGLAASNAPVAILIGIVMVVLDVPLAFTVALVTFVTSFVPYLGAIVSGAFATLVALGASGLEDAIIILIVVLVGQNIIGTVLMNKLTSDALAINPIANLASTIVGATLAGVIGATLSAPLLATLLAARARLRRADAESIPHRDPSAGSGRICERE